MSVEPAPVIHLAPQLPLTCTLVSGVQVSLRFLGCKKGCPGLNLSQVCGLCVLQTWGAKAAPWCLESWLCPCFLWPPFLLFAVSVVDSCSWWGHGGPAWVFWELVESRYIYALAGAPPQLSQRTL